MAGIRLLGLTSIYYKAGSPARPRLAGHLNNICYSVWALLSHAGFFLVSLGRKLVQEFCQDETLLPSLSVLVSLWYLNGVTLSLLVLS